MKRLLVVIALVVVAVIGIDVLADLTQSRPDAIEAGSQTEIILVVDEDGFGPGNAAAADALWAVCAAQTRSRPTEHLRPLGDSRYRVVLAPAVGHHERRKLVGCLEDLTIDRVLGEVESFETAQSR